MDQGKHQYEGSYRWQVVGMLWLVCFFNYADRQAVYSVFPLLQQELHLTTVQLGLVGSAFAWMYALAGPVAGTLLDRMQRKVAVLAGLEVWSVICAATALSRTFRSLLIFRAAEGLGESIYFPASMSTLAAYHPGKTRSRAFGLHQTSVYAGTVAGGLLAGLLAQRYGWRSPFVVFGTCGVLLGLLLLRWLREPPAPAEPLPTVGLIAFFRVLIQRRGAVLLMLAFAAMNFVAVVQLSWLPLFLYQRFHLGLARAAFDATVLAQSGAALGALAGGALADARSHRPGGRIPVQMLGAVCGLPCVVLCGLAPTLGLTLLSLFFWGFCKGLYDANVFASLYDYLPAGVRGVSTGVMNSSAWLLGGTTAPVLVGWLAGRYGLHRAIAGSSIGYLLAALLLAAALLYRRVDGTGPLNAQVCSNPDLVGYDSQANTVGFGELQSQSAGRCGADGRGGQVPEASQVAP